MRNRSSAQFWASRVNHTALWNLPPFRHCWDTSMCLSRLDGDVSAACWKINYLQPLLRLQRAGKPFSPQSGGKVGGFEGEEGVQRRSRQSLGNPCVTCPDMPKPATYLWRLHSRGTWLHLKSLLSRIHMENKAGGPRRCKTLPVWERKRDVIVFFFFFSPLRGGWRVLLLWRHSPLLLKNQLAMLKHN